MRTGNRNRINYKRTTGSRTARLYSQRTARKITRIYMDTEQEEARAEAGALNDRSRDRAGSAAQDRGKEHDKDRSRDVNLYNDYYDRPVRKGPESDRMRATTIIAAVLIVAVLAAVFVGLSLLKPGDDRIDLVQSTTETTGAETQTTQFEESEPPTIYGVMPIIVYAGHSVTYKQGVYVVDDTDDAPTLEIDNEEVDLSTPGTYIVSYIARDKDRNVTREFTSVTVLEGKNLIEDEAINELADTVLASITTEDMDDTMKCLKVYEYLHAIGYVDEVHSEDWRQNAYWMLTKREGDCFCYYSASRLLLTRLGYEVMEVRNNNNYVHYWCLVSLDGGETWWHFDPCCWSWGEDGILCLVSDDYLSEFTRRHRTSDGRLIHAWDMTNYPATPQEDFWTDDDRSVIYESGLIEPGTLAYQDDSLWENQGWDNYIINYDTYVYPETYDYNAYDAGAYDAGAYDINAFDFGDYDIGTYDFGADDTVEDAGAYDPAAFDWDSLDLGAYDPESFDFSAFDPAAGE